MVTKILTSVKAMDTGSDDYRQQYEYRGLSTDEKPIEDVANSDVFYEMDTKKVSMFDKDNLVWLPQ